MSFARYNDNNKGAVNCNSGVAASARFLVGLSATIQLQFRALKKLQWEWMAIQQGRQRRCTVADLLIL